MNTEESQMASSKFYNPFRLLVVSASNSSIQSFRRWYTLSKEKAHLVYYNNLFSEKGKLIYDPCDLLLFLYLDDEYARALKPRHGISDGRGRNYHKKLMKVRVPLRLSETPEHIII